MAFLVLIFCSVFSICWFYAMYRYAPWHVGPTIIFFSTIWAYLAAFSLAACPTPANKIPSASPQCLPGSSWNSQCNVSLPDNTHPTETLPKALIFPHYVNLSLGLSSLSYWTHIVITTCQGTCASSLTRLLQPVLFPVYGRVRNSTHTAISSKPC